MNLISTLNAGIAAAANGWAEVYIRGTSTRATVFYDFEASASDSSGDNIDLDAYGAVEVYVNQLVDIVAKSPDGTVIRSWTDGYSSPNVEVISPAFTGNDYVSGAAAVNEPTTLQAVLNLWSTNAGAPDWKVLIGGANTTLLNAFGSLTGLVFNVKNPAYGAVGNGIANDQAAIQATLAAAIAAGGGIVFFPRGTYLISTAMEWDHRVSVMGVGGGQSIITTNSGSNDEIIQWTTGTAQDGPVYISGMAFASTQANAGSQVYSNVGVNLVIERCLFGATANALSESLVRFEGGSRFVVRDSVFLLNGSSSNSAAVWSVDSYGTFDRCRIRTTGTDYTDSMIKPGGVHDSIRSCEFNVSSLTTGTFSAIEAINAAGSVTIDSCSFFTSVQSWVFIIKLLAGQKCTVSGCYFQGIAAFNWYSVPGPLGVGSSLQLDGNSRTDSGLTSFTVPAATRVATYRVTGTVPTFTLPTILYPGQELTVITENQGAGAFGGNVTYNGDTEYGSTTPTTAGAGNAVFANWLAVAMSSGVTQWVMTSLKIGSGS